MKTLMVAINAKYVHTNIVVRYITGCAKQQGLDVDFCEFTVNEPQNSVLGKLYAADCDAYGFSCYIWNIGYVLKLCRNLKKLLPDRKIFLGGPEVSFDAEKLLSENEYIDCIVCGEGELAVPELLKNFPTDRKVVYGEKIENLSDLPFPYNDADLKTTVAGEKLIYYETSRGCPFNCSYCLSSVDSGVRFMPLDRVKAEIKKMSDMGAITVKFVDRTFNADKKRALKIWEYCIKLDTKTCFHFEIGADLLDDEALEILRTAPEGRFQFEIGIQSTNEKTVSEICRVTNLERLAQNIKNLRLLTKVHLHVDLIAGLPYEKFKSFEKSFNDAYDMLPNVIQLGFLKFLKGSPMRERAEEYGAVFDSFAPYEVFSTSWISYNELLRLKSVEDVLERYFNSDRFGRTLKMLVPMFETPFSFYHKLALFWEEKNLVGQGVKRISLYGLLYEFMQTQISEEQLKTVMPEMKKDFSDWHSNGIGTPDWYKLY